MLDWTVVSSNHPSRSLYTVGAPARRHIRFLRTRLVCAYPIAQAYGQGSYAYLLLGILSNIRWTFGPVATIAPSVSYAREEPRCHHPRLQLCREFNHRSKPRACTCTGRLFAGYPRRSVGLAIRNSLLVKPQPM